MGNYNSTIKAKWGTCLDCGPEAGEKPLIAKRCTYHYQAHRHQASLDRKKVRGLVSASPQRGRIVKDQALEDWFAMIATIIRASPFCMECRTPIPEAYYRHASAHVLPKSIFPSVATHPLNYLVLGASCGCHVTFDHSIDKACKMKIWPIAVSRFRLILPAVKETHKYLDLFKSKM